MELFNRSVHVEIATKSGSLLTIKGLRIVFNVTKDDSEKPNEATVSIYNLSKETMNKIQDLRSDEVEKGTKIFLYAGYLAGAGEELLFAGDLTKVNRHYEKPDVSIEMTAHDGKAGLYDARVSVSVGENASAKDVLKTILGTFAIGNNFARTTFEDKIYANGFAYAGPSRAGLTKVATYLGLYWSVQEGEISFAKLGEPLVTSLLLISPTTGLVGSPERIFDEKRKSEGKEKKNRPGWRITSVLFPSLRPMGRIALKCADIPEGANYKIVSVKHSGDTHGDDWRTVCEVIG